MPGIVAGIALAIVGTLVAPAIILHDLAVKPKQLDIYLGSHLHRLDG